LTMSSWNDISAGYTKARRPQPLIPDGAEGSSSRRANGQQGKQCEMRSSEKKIAQKCVVSSTALQKSPAYLTARNACYRIEPARARWTERQAEQKYCGGRYMTYSRARYGNKRYAEPFKMHCSSRISCEPTLPSLKVLNREHNSSRRSRPEVH